MSQQRTPCRHRQSNTLNVFPAGSPFSDWGNRAIQTALGQLLYVPSATVGEVAYVANTLQQRFPTGSRANFSTVSDAWWNEWNTLAGRLRGAAANEADDASRRSLLLRALVYSFVASIPRVPGPEVVQQYQRAQEDFKAAAPLFGAYDIQPFNYTFDNGTASQQFGGFMALPPGMEQAPLMVVFGNLFHWKEMYASE